MLHATYQESGAPEAPIPANRMLTNANDPASRGAPTKIRDQLPGQGHGRFFGKGEYDI